MSLIRAFLKLPTGFWILVFAGFMYYHYSTWKTQELEPIEQELVQAKQELATVVRQNKAAEDFGNQRDQRFQELQNLAQEFNRALEKLPKTPDIPGILTSLADISDRVGLEFSKFEPGKGSLKGFLTETPFKVELRGTFVQIMSFMDEVAHVKRIISGKSLDFKDAAPRGDKAVLKAYATLLTYHFDEKAVAEAAAAEQAAAAAANPSGAANPAPEASSPAAPTPTEVPSK